MSYMDYTKLLLEQIGNTKRAFVSTLSEEEREAYLERELKALKEAETKIQSFKDADIDRQNAILESVVIVNPYNQKRLRLHTPCGRSLNSKKRPYTIEGWFFHIMMCPNQACVAFHDDLLAELIEEFDR